ncbi:hypothetical protein GBAR_LOCUS28407 [Geodia barretti]|uniref:Uncharacterized protein n=1 Tax=Geodia barretti TaxID=519541 RepID=A0AA35TQI9_GEOBA|nr:hypothetical protein GBAR_LOCUS28407 [Geodia barretti]
MASYSFPKLQQKHSNSKQSILQTSSVMSKTSSGNGGTGVGSEDRSFTLLVKAEVGFVNDSSLMESDEMGPRTGKVAPLPLRAKHNAHLSPQPESASCSVGGSDSVWWLQECTSRNPTMTAVMVASGEERTGEGSHNELPYWSAPSNDSQGSMNPEGEKNVSAKLMVGTMDLILCILVIFCAAPLRETKWRSGYIVNKTVCYANLIEKEQGNEEFHQFPVAEDKNAGENILKADITMVSGRQGSVGTSVPGTLGLRPEPLLEETKNASSLFLGQIQRPQKVPHSKPLVQATHLVSKCRRRKKGGTTPEICQDPWLGNYHVELIKSLHINVDLGFGNCNESFYGSSCQ